MTVENKIIIGKWEAFALVVNAICTKIFLNFPRLMAEKGYTAGWILAIYISILALLGFIVISMLYSRFEGKDLLDIGELAGGNVGRIAVGSIVLMFLLYIVSVVLREFGENMKIISLTVSPISFVILFFLAGMIAGAYCGLEAVVRFNAIAVPVIAAGYMFIIIAVSQYFELSNVLPILGSGAYEIFVKGFFKVSVYAELLILFLIAPFIRTNKNFKLVGYSVMGSSAFFLIISTLIFLIVLPYPTGIESFLPVYQLARLINYGRFFQRIESMFVLIWAAAALMYLSTGFFFIVYIFKKTFKLEYYKPLIIPFAIIVFNLSLLPPSLNDAVELETTYFRNSAWVVTFVMVILVLLIARLRKGRVKKESIKGG